MSAASSSVASFSPPSSSAASFNQHIEIHRSHLLFLPNQRRTLPTIATKLHVSSPSNKSSISAAARGGAVQDRETIYFDGGAHYGDLLANLLFGFTLFWLPLTIASVSRAFFLRYRFSNLRVTVVSGFTGEDRSDFGYKSIKDVQVVPRLVGEWGDIIITLKDGTKVDLRSVPKFREIAKYCLEMAELAPGKAEGTAVVKEGGPKGF